MNCYGRFRQNQQCLGCNWLKYCRDASDPMLLGDKPPRKSDQPAMEITAPGGKDALKNEEKRYSRADLIEVIGFMASLDEYSLRFIQEKIEDPTLNLSDIAIKRNVSRQAIHKMVKDRIAKVPELAAVITYRHHKTNHKPNKTLMEEVCEIRLKRSNKKSKTPKPASNYLKNLIFLSRSTFLSQTNILKGSSILSRDFSK